MKVTKAQQETVHEFEKFAKQARHEVIRQDQTAFFSLVFGTLLALTWHGPSRGASKRP